MPWPGKGVKEEWALSSAYKLRRSFRAGEKAERSLPGGSQTAYAKALCAEVLL